jgi:hypothetical protein
MACREESRSDVGGGGGGRKNLTIKNLSWEGQNICCSKIRKKKKFVMSTDYIFIFSTDW